MKKNIFYLYLVQISNYVIPLLTLPYLLRVLGVEGFGKLMLCQALVQYLILITDFGFNFSATRKIAQAQDKTEIDNIFTNTISAKIILLVISFFLLAIVINALDMFSDIKSITIVLFIMVIGNAFYPVFFFQGIEKMKNIAWVSITSKVVLFIGLLFFVKEKNDLIKAAYVFSICSLLPAIFSYCVIACEKYTKYNGFNFIGAMTEIKDSLPLFISQVSISFYSTFNILLLGMFFSPTIVGFYAAADKLRSAVQAGFLPIQQVIFPRINKDKKNYRANFKKFGSMFIGFSFCVSLSIFILGEPLSLVYFGHAFAASAILFKWMSFLIFIISIAIVFAQWGLISIGHEKILTKIYLLGAIAHLCYSPFIVAKHGIYSMLGCVIVTEIGITMLIVYFFIKHWRNQ